MKKATDIDDIEQMFTDIVGQDGDQAAFTPVEKVHRRLSDAIDKAPRQQFFEYSETPTPAHEPLEFVASPIEKTQELLRSASSSSNDATPTPGETPKATPQGSSLDIVEAAAPAVAKETAKETPREPKPSLASTTSTLQPPSDAANALRIEVPKPSPQLDFRETKAVDAPAQLDVSPRTAPASPTLDEAPALGSELHPLSALNSTRPRRGSELQTPETTQQMQSLAVEGGDAVRRERESTSEGVPSVNLSADPEGALAKAIRRASGETEDSKAEAKKAVAEGNGAQDGAPTEGTGRRPSRLETLTRTGTPAEIRAERNSTSEGILSPNLSANPQGDMEQAIRRASQSKPRRPFIERKRSSISASSAIDDSRYASPKETPQSPRTFRLQSLTKEGTPAQIRAERESTSEGVLSPNTSKDPQGDMAAAIRRASQSKPSPGQRRRLSSNAVDDSEDAAAVQSPRTFRLQSITKEGTPAQIRAERESTSQGVLSPNLSADPQGDMATAIRRASSSAGSAAPRTPVKRDSLKVERPAFNRRGSSFDTPTSPRTFRLQSLARDGTPAEIRAERDSTSEGILSPNRSADPASDMEKAIRRASSHGLKSPQVPRHRRGSSFAVDVEEDAEAQLRSPRTVRLESLTKEGTPAQIRAERNSTSEGVLSPNHSKDPQGDMAAAIRRASSVNGKRPSLARGPSLTVEDTSALNPISRTERLESLATEGSPAQIRAERESTSEGVEDPSKAGDASAAIASGIRRASMSRGSQGSAGRPRRSSSAAEDAVISPPQPALQEAASEIPAPEAHKRLSSSAVVESEQPIGESSPRTHRLESITAEGTPAQIRAERESTSEGVDDPTKGGNPEKVIEKAVRRASSSSASPPPLRSSVHNPDEHLESPANTPAVPLAGASESPRKDTAGSAAAAAAAAAATAAAAARAPEIEPIQEATEPNTPAAEPQKPLSDTVYLYMSMASGGRGAMQNFQKASGILQTYNIKFTPVEISLDEDAKKLWKYRGIAKGKQLPAVVRDREIKLDFKALLDANENEEVEEIIFEEF